MRCLAPTLLVATFLVAAQVAPAEEPFQSDLRLDAAEPREDEAPAARKTFLLPCHQEHWPKKYLEWIIKDPINLATRPIFWGGDQWKTFAIETGITGVLLPLDDPVRDVVQDNRSTTLTDILDPIRDNFTGDRLELFGVGLFAGGVLLRNEKRADTGLLATESVFYSIHISGILKSLTHRERPSSAGDQFEFNGRGGSTRGGSSSFVSGDVIAAYAFASSASEVCKIRE